MDIVLIVLLGIAGAAFGFVLPNIAQRIAIYKYHKKEMELPDNPHYTATYTKLILCAMNGAVWALSGILSEHFTVAVLISFLFSIAVLITIIDLRIRIVPNELLLVMVVAGLTFQGVQFGLIAVLISVLCMLAMMFFFSVVAGMVGFDKVGAGDVKLAGAMGLALGYPNIVTAMIIMCAVFLLFSAVGLILRKITLKTMLPFAPFMMIGMVFSLANIVLQLPQQ